MGEAKRRRGRQAQRGDDSPETPVNEFRVADGMVALTLDVHGINPVTVCVEAAKLDETLRHLDSVFDPEGKARRGWAGYARLRSYVIASLRHASANGENMDAQCLAGLWCVFNHPTGSGALRRRVSEALRQTGKAHITMACDARDAVAVALSETFVELNPLMSSAPVGQGICVVVEQEAGTTVMH